MRNIIRIGAGTDGRNRFVAIALGVALAAGPAAMMPAAALAAPATDAAAASTTAGTTITLQGADGASLAGHTFDVYRIGTYTDQILNGTRISSLGVRGDTASNAWAADAIGIANAYDPSTADDIGKVYGYDDAGNIANIKMDSQARQLRNISKALAQSSRRPAAIQGGANLTTTQSTLTINVPAEGFYYITDSAGNPIMVGTKSGNANIMKNDAKDPQWRTLGVAVVKAKSVRGDKKVQVSRDGRTVGKDGTATNPVGVTVGDTVTNTVEVTVPNKQAASAVKFKLVDQPKGQTYVKGSLSVRLKNAPRLRPVFRRCHGTIYCTNRRCMMTQAVAYSNFRANLKTYMRKVNEDADTLLVTNADPEDNVVVMSADDYDSLMETLRVYQNPYLSDKVMRGMAQVRQGQTMAHDLVEAGA